MMKNPADRATPWRLTAALVLLAGTFLVYGRALGHDFLSDWDDNLYVTGNPDVKSITLENLGRVFTSFYAGNYAPLQMISYMLDWSLWGSHATGFILTNLLLHALNAFFFFALLACLRVSALPRLLASLLFLVHPVQVESVVWISQRKNLLAMTFFLLAWKLYVCYRDAGVRPGRRRLYAASVVSFLLALLAKPVAVVLVPVLVLYDFCFERERPLLAAVLDKVPFLVSSGVFATVAYWSQSPEQMGGRSDWYGGGPLSTLFTMLPVLARYLGMLFWPAQLSAQYNPPVRAGIDSAVLASAALAALLAVLGVYVFRRLRRLFFWFALFFLGLLPVLQIVPIVTLMNDRYLYFPMLGAAGVSGTLLETSMGAASPRSRYGALALCSILVLSLAGLSFHRTAVWRNAVTLWTDATLEVPDLADAWRYLGAAYTHERRTEEAIGAYRRCLELDPGNLDAALNLGMLQTDAGRPLLGRPTLLDLNARFPDDPRVLTSLGLSSLATNELVEAETFFHRAIAKQARTEETKQGPGQIRREQLRRTAIASWTRKALEGLGQIRLKQRQLGEAREFYLQAAASGGATADIEYNLACVEALAGNQAAALAHLRASLSLGLTDPEQIAEDPDLESLRTLPEFRVLTHGPSTGPSLR